MAEFDVAVVGAGMAGIVAARDLSRLGYSVVLLEGRDRIGGRTYTAEAFNGELELDLGGAYVHWASANVWYELQRHGIPIRAPLLPKTVYWLADGAVHTGTGQEYAAMCKPLADRLVSDARLRFPRPWDVIAVDNSDIESVSIDDRLCSMNLTRYEKDLIETRLAGLSSSYKDQGLDHLLFWTAQYFGSLDAFKELGGSYSIDGGMRRLQEAIMNESSATVRLSTPVTSIKQYGKIVTLATPSGQVHARRAVVACPINTLGNITFDPELPPLVRKLVVAKQPITGGKIWIRLKGKVEPFAILAPPGLSFLNSCRTEQYLNGDTLLMCIVSQAKAINADPETVQAELRRFIPDLEVVDIAYHDWVGDEFSQGAWAMHRPGILTKVLPQMREPHDRIYFAGADIAALDITGISGAMGSGAIAARDIAHQLAAEDCKGMTNGDWAESVH